MSFAENLQELRKKNGLTQEGLAEMLGVSRQAVSKWELGEGYPEVEKLLALSKKMSVSLDSLLCCDISENGLPGPAASGMPLRTITITSPKEGVIISASRIVRTQEFKGGKNSPRYALFASDGNDASFWGVQNTFLAWYRDLDDVNKEILAIRSAIEAGESSYTLQYSVRYKKGLFNSRIVE